MCRLGEIIAAVTLCVCLSSVGIAATGYSISVTPATDIPTRTGTVNGNEYSISAVTRTTPDQTLTVSASGPTDSLYDVQFRSPDNSVIDFTDSTGDLTWDLDLSSYTNIAAGSYALTLRDREFKEVYPIIVSGYDLSVTAPTQVDPDGTIPVSATVSERDIPKHSTLDYVQVAIGDDNSRTVSKLSERADGSYATDVSASELGTGEYTLSVIVRGDKSVRSQDEILGVSDPITVTIGDPTTETPTPTETPTQTTTPTATATQTPTQTTSTTDTDSASSGGAGGAGGVGVSAPAPEPASEDETVTATTPNPADIRTPGDGPTAAPTQQPPRSTPTEPARAEVTVTATNDSSVTASVTVNDTTASTTSAEIDANAASEDGSVRADTVEIETSSTAGSYTASVSASSDTTDGPTDDTVGSVSVNHSVADTDIAEASFVVGVSQARLQRENVSRDDVSLYRRHEGEWTPLNTDHIGTNNTTELYRARSPGLSKFAIADRSDTGIHVDNTSINRTRVFENEPVSVDAVVENPTATTQSTNVTFTVSGDTSVQTVTVPAGESRNVTHTLRMSDPTDGMPYRVYTDGVYVGSVTVYASQAETTQTATATAQPSTSVSPRTTTGDGGPGFTLVIGVLSIIVAAVVAVRYCAPSVRSPRTP